MASTAISGYAVDTFAPMSARRLLVFAGISLIAAGMLFGDIFAVFVLHQNGGRTGRALLLAAHAASERDEAGVQKAFADVGALLEDRGTKVDTHVHMTDAGYLALLLALVQPFIALPPKRKQGIAKFFVAGSVMLPVGIFLIHYVGLAYSPFSVIGWASVLADAGGAVLIIALIAEAWGLRRYLQGERFPAEAEVLNESSWSQRTLLGGGTVLILFGFLYGAWFSAVDLYPQEKQELGIFHALVDRAAAGDNAGMAQSVSQYDGLAATHAVAIAAHSHAIEFGLLAMLLSFIQPYVFLREAWKRRWVVVLLAGALLLPIFVLLELPLGFLAAGIADVSGLMVVTALVAMLVGVLRHSGSLDAGAAR